MKCNLCNKRDRCVKICSQISRLLPNLDEKDKEIPIEKEKLNELNEIYLAEKMAQYLNRHAEFLPALKKRLERLSPRQRTLIRLFYKDGYTVTEISKKLKIDHSTVSRRIDKVMAILLDENSAEKSEGRP